MVSDLIQDITRQLIMAESEHRKQISKSNFPINSYVQVNQQFETFR